LGAFAEKLPNLAPIWNLMALTQCLALSA